MDPLCPECPLLAVGELPRCAGCDRVQLDDDALDALEINRLLQLGMDWELALTAYGWRGTRDDLYALARRVQWLREEQARPAAGK